jgi:hypothetical protein
MSPFRIGVGLGAATAALVLSLAVACAPAVRPTTPGTTDMGDGVKCYTYYQSAISCVKVK